MNNYRLKLLFIGPTGAGKSTALTTLPGRKLYLDYDGRKESLIGYPDIEILDCYEPDARSPKAWNRSQEICTEIVYAIRTGKFPYSAIIEDGLSSLNRYCMNWALLLNPARGFGGAPVEGHYGAHGTNLMNHILGMVALPIHYILTCHYSMVEAGANVLYTTNVWGRQLRNSIPTVFTEVWMAARQSSGTTKGTYQIFTTPTGPYDFLKSGLNIKERYWKDPVTIDLDAPDPKGISKLFQLRFPQQASPEKEVLVTT